MNDLAGAIKSAEAASSGWVDIRDGNNQIVAYVGTARAFRALCDTAALANPRPPQHRPKVTRKQRKDRQRARRAK